MQKVVVYDISSEQHRHVNLRTYDQFLKDFECLLACGAETFNPRESILNRDSISTLMNSFLRHDPVSGYVEGSIIYTQRRRNRIVTLLRDRRVCCGGDSGDSGRDPGF